MQRNSGKGLRFIMHIFKPLLSYNFLDMGLLWSLQKGLGAMSGMDKDIFRLTLVKMTQYWQKEGSRAAFQSTLS